MDATIFEALFQIVTLPFQLIDVLVTGMLNILVFDLLQLGPFLPIQF